MWLTRGSSVLALFWLTLSSRVCHLPDRYVVDEELVIPGAFLADRLDVRNARRKPGLSKTIASLFLFFLFRCPVGLCLAAIRFYRGL